MASLREARRVAACLLGLALGCVRGEAAVSIHVATDPVDWVAWGNVSDNLGCDSVIGDVNGDKIPDLVFFRAIYPGGELDIYFGPFTMPSTHDLASEVPAVRISGTPNPNSQGIYSSVLTAMPPLHDLDGDGTVDLVAGSRTFPLNFQTGWVWVFRGRPTWPAQLSVTNADWTIRGARIEDDLSHWVTGDLNGDGQADIVVFAVRSDATGGARPESGAAYVFFGPLTRFPALIDLAVTAPDVTILGADEVDHPGLYAYAAIGDVLGDAIPDLVFASPWAGGPINALNRAGEVYVLRGRKTWPALIDLRDPGSADLLVYGAASEDDMGPVALGDLDSDGRKDLIIAASSRNTIYVLRGKASLAGVIDLASATVDAVVTDSSLPSRRLGINLAVADVDGDGRDDLVAGSTTGAGAVFVISGCASLAPLRDLALEPADLAIYGADPGDGMSIAVSLGDLDGDGRADIFAGAYASRSLGNSRGILAGEAYVLRGRDFASPRPPDQGNVLKAVKLGEDVVLDFTAAPATLWRAYRDVSKLTLGTTALAPDAPVPRYTDLGIVPLAPALDFYQVKGLTPCTLLPGP